MDGRGVSLFWCGQCWREAAGSQLEDGWVEDELVGRGSEKGL